MTPLNPPSYNWTSPHPGIYHRPALSTESLWFTRPKDLHEMFITSHLTFSRPHTHYPKIRLKEAARRAWKRLRFEVPELGIRAVINDGEVFLEYKMLDEVGVRGWISRTLFFGESEGDYEFESLRKDIVSRKDCEEQASVLLNFETRDSAVFGDRGEELVDGVYLILNTDHQITDGIGTRILLGRFLELFSQYVRVEMDCKENLVWEDSYKNLTQPWIGRLDGMQKLEGRKSVETCERNRNHLFHETSAKINPSLPLKEYLPFSSTSSPHPTFPQVSTQKTHFLTLPPEETTSILTAVKRFSKTATITHAIHAAMVVTLLCPSFQQSPSPKLSTFNSSCWFNGRRYLMPAEQNSYIPPCQSFFPICFTDLQDLRLTKNPGREERRALMLRTLEITMGQYLALKEERGLGLCSTITLMEEIGWAMRGKNIVKEEDERGKGEKMERFAVPLFLSDGITENYIARSSPNSGTAISSENERYKTSQIEAGRQDILVVRDVHFGANAGDEVILRIATFRSQLRISVEWKEDLFDGVMVMKFLEEIKCVLLSLL